MLLAILSAAATASAAANPLAGYDWSSLALEALALVSTLLSALLAWVGGAVRRWLVSKTKSEVAGRVSDLAFQVVLEIQQTVAAKIREAAADGVITAEEKAAIKEAALDVLRSRVGAKGITEIKAVLGYPPDQIDGFLGGLIESAVFKLKLMTPPAPKTIDVVAKPVEAPPSATALVTVEEPTDEPVEE